MFYSSKIGGFQWLSFCLLSGQTIWSIQSAIRSGLHAPVWVLVLSVMMYILLLFFYLHTGYRIAEHSIILSNGFFQQRIAICRIAYVALQFYEGKPIKKFCIANHCALTHEVITLVAEDRRILARIAPKRRRAFLKQLFFHPDFRPLKMPSQPFDDA